MPARPDAIAAQRPNRSGEEGGAARRPPPSRRSARRRALRVPEEIWGRRAALLGAGLLIAAAIGGAALLGVALEDGGSSAISDAEASERAREVASGSLPELAADKRAGIGVRHPESWTASRRDGIVTVESADRCAAVAVSAPGSAQRAGEVLEASVAGLKADFDGVKLEPGQDQEVGLLPTSSRVADVSNEAGEPVRILVHVGTGRKYAYLTQVVLRDPSCEASQAEAQLVLSALTLTK